MHGPGGGRPSTGRPPTIRHGRVLESGIQTGTLHFTMLTDGLGYLTRNPFRGANQEPDDVQSPAWVGFTMDAVVSSEDPHGRVPASATASRASRRPQVEWAPL